MRTENREFAGDRLVRVKRPRIVDRICTTDEETQLPIHGYEIHTPTAPVSPAELGFEAHERGRFPIATQGFGDEPGIMHQKPL